MFRLAPTDMLTYLTESEKKVRPGMRLIYSYLKSIQSQVTANGIPQWYETMNSGLSKNRNSGLCISLLQKEFVGAGKNVFLGGGCGTRPYFLQLKMLFPRADNAPPLKTNF